MLLIAPVALAGLFSAGASLATGLLGQKKDKKDRAQTAEENEKDRQLSIFQQAKTLELEREKLAQALGIANIQTDAQKAQTQANLVSNRGKQAGGVMQANMQAYANNPERFQSAVDTLVGSLK